VRRLPRRPAAAAALGFVFVLPVAYLLLGSLRPAGVDPPAGLSFWPDDPGLDAYRRVFELIPIERELLNSTLVAAVAVPLSVLTASWAGFAISRLPPRARNLLLGLSLVLLMVPLSALWVPRFVLFREAGLIDTYVPLIAPALMGGSPFYVLLFYWSYRRLPPDLIDAARLEGLSPFALWHRVASPLVRPMSFAVGVLAFVLHWGNFVDPLIYLNDPDLHTAPLGLRELQGLAAADLPVLLAGSVLVAAPAVLAFALVQRQFLNATRGAGWLGR
jgi:multiple sugar transport system permease protein